MNECRPSLAGCRVLVLEDEYLLASDLMDALIAIGAEVIGPISQLDRAQDQLAAGGFDVAVVDINLRGNETYPIADQLQRAGVPFLFATGYSEKLIPIRFRDVTRWEKPYDVSGLVEDLRELCRRAAQ